MFLIKIKDELVVIFSKVNY